MPDLQDCLHGPFNNATLLEEAFIAAGAAVSRHDVNGPKAGNKRLALVGDGVLRLCVLDEWFLKGGTTALQNTPSLKLLSALTFTDMAHDGPTEINTAWTDGCFALFVLADVSNDDINQVISEAAERLSDYLFWLADDWSSAPKRGLPAELGTKPPIPAVWQSPFRGKTVNDVVAFMKTVPAERNIDYHHFCVLGEDFQKRKLVTMWRIGDIDLVGDELDSLPISAAGATEFLFALESHCWEETKGCYPEGYPVDKPLD